MTWLEMMKVEADKFNAAARKTKKRVRDSEYRKRNRAKCRAYHRAYIAAHKGKYPHPSAEYQRAWRAAHPGRNAAYKRAQRARQAAREAAK